MSTKPKGKPSLAVWKFSSCDGCQLTILDCEDELLALADAVDIANFPEASREVKPGPYDLSLVEGSITNPHDAERIHWVREQSRYLVSIGACATSGGIQALRNFADVDEYASIVYAHPDYIHALETSTAISDHVKVDFELFGCPIDKGRLLELITTLLHGGKPRDLTESVCLDCKRRGVVCLMTARGQPCLGPVTRSGCGALCTAYDRPCFGCFGPKPEANCAPLTDWCLDNGSLSNESALRLFRTFNANAPAFDTESTRHEEKNHQSRISGQG